MAPARCSGNKLLIKKKGRHNPDLRIHYTSAGKGRTYNRVFNRNIYEKYEWICGCSVTNKLFCFMCLIFKKNKLRAWNKHGLVDLKHIAERAKKHENSVSRIKIGEWTLCTKISSSIYYRISRGTDVYPKYHSGVKYTKEKHSFREIMQSSPVTELLCLLQYGLWIHIVKLYSWVKNIFDMK
ncbi:unnamed protein product [Brassicogethes aeneus]|uniref:Zinc finger MYM-type protein 1-like n=1 Tax=Brassicogethes aeneus TaxID=1431903 RepID=A0A9P0B4N0_BRAAE|nr:unnamed protein product [Brassicogethes aeneus]